jgi:Tfp pilus assembly protein PilP
MPTHLPSACAATNGPDLARYIQQGRAGKKKKVARIQYYLHPAILEKVSKEKEHI